MIDKEEFWNIISGVNETATDQWLKAPKLQELLLTKTREDIGDFYLQFKSRMSEADTADLWAAASILNEGYLSDDSYMYFRYWLISLGRDCFEKAVVNPESMVTIEVPLDSEGHPNPTDEDFYYAIFDAYEQLTGEEIQSEIKVANFLKTIKPEASIDWQIYTATELEKRFPKLWAEYLRTCKNRDEAYKRFAVE